MHFGTGVLGTSAWAGVYVAQVCFYTNVHICEHTRCRLCAYVYISIYVYMHAYVYGCVCASIILLDTLRRCYLSVHTCAYACVCICVCMFACIGACVYVCICIYVCLCICIHIHFHTRACGCTYALVYAHFVYLYFQSFYYMRVYHKCFLTPACVCVRGLEVRYFSACSWLALVAGVGGYVLVGVEIGVLSCIFSYFCGC